MDVLRVSYNDVSSSPFSEGTYFGDHEVPKWWNRNPSKQRSHVTHKQFDPSFSGESQRQLLFQNWKSPEIPYNTNSINSIIRDFSTVKVYQYHRNPLDSQPMPDKCRTCFGQLLLIWISSPGGPGLGQGVPGLASRIDRWLGLWYMNH